MSPVSGKLAGDVRSPDHIAFDVVVAEFQRLIDGDGIAEEQVHGGKCYKAGCYTPELTLPQQEADNYLYLDTTWSMQKPYSL